MGLQLPGELVEVLGWIGMTWPQGDEEKLFQLGKTWLDFAGTIQQAVQQSNTAAGQVWYGNGGTDIEAFQEYWTGHGPAGALNLAHTAATILGVPIFQQITRAILENLLWQAIGEILGG